MALLVSDYGQQQRALEVNIRFYGDRRPKQRGSLLNSSRVRYCQLSGQVDFALVVRPNRKRQLLVGLFFQPLIIRPFSRFVSNVSKASGCERSGIGIN